MPWTTIELAGKSADRFLPEQGSPRHAIVFLHGYDGVGLKENSSYTQEFERHALDVICPRGPKCCWTDAVYPTFDPEVSPVEFLFREIPKFAGREKLAVFGIELGGQGALQLAYRHARTFSVVAAISPKVDFDEWHGLGTSLDEIFPDREAARQATATLHIHPLDWPRHQLLLCDPADLYCRDGVAILASKLSSSGIPFEGDFHTSHGGYGWGYADAMAGRVVAFLAEKLEHTGRHAS
jgi:S-formylglutathione hydrolase